MRSIPVPAVTAFVCLALGCAHPASAPDGGPTSGLPSVGPLGGKVITTNQGDGTLSVVEPATGKFDGPILVPVVDEANMEMPHEISTDPNGRFFIVNLMEMPASDRSTFTSEGEIAMMNSTIPGYLLKLSPVDGSLMAKLEVDPDPGDNALSPDGKVAYVSHFNEPQVLAVLGAGDMNIRHMDSDLWAVDSASMTALAKLPICPEAHTLELSPDGKRLYASCLNDEVAVVDISTPGEPSLIARASEVNGGPDGGTVEVVPSSASHLPFALQVSPSDGSVWVSDWGSPGNPPDLRVMDATTLAFTTVIPTISNALPIFTTFSQDGKTVYNAHQQPDGLAIYDGETRAQTADIALHAPDCINPHQVMLAADGKTAYVLCEGDHKNGGQYVILDLTTKKVVSSTSIGIYPVEMDLLPPPQGS